MGEITSQCARGLACARTAPFVSSRVVINHQREVWATFNAPAFRDYDSSGLKRTGFRNVGSAAATASTCHHLLRAVWKAMAASYSRRIKVLESSHLSAALICLRKSPHALLPRFHGFHLLRPSESLSVEQSWSEHVCQCGVLHLGPAMYCSPARYNAHATSSSMAFT